MPDPQTSDMRYILGKWCQRSLSLASSRFSKLWIPFVDDLLDGDLCKNFVYFHIISVFFWFSLIILSYTIIHWFYQYHYFKHSKWWRRKLGHTEDFADDIALSEESVYSMQDSTSVLEVEASRVGICKNPDKCKVMVSSTWSPGLSTVEVDDEFCYLGSYISQNATVKRTWKYVSEKRQLYSARWRRLGGISVLFCRQNRDCISTALILLNLLYGVEVWPLTSYRHIEQKTGSGWEAFLVSPGGTKSQMKKYGKNRTNTSSEGDLRKKDAMAWSCHENGWGTHSEASATLGSWGIQEKTWQTKDELERCGPPKNAINLGRGWNISSRQTFVASTCGLMHRWCWMNQVKSRICNTSDLLYSYARFIVKIDEKFSHNDGFNTI